MEHKSTYTIHHFFGITIFTLNRFVRIFWACLMPMASDVCPACAARSAFPTQKHILFFSFIRGNLYFFTKPVKEIIAFQPRHRQALCIKLWVTIFLVLSSAFLHASVLWCCGLLFFWFLNNCLRFHYRLIRIFLYIWNNVFFRVIRRLRR